MPQARETVSRRCARWSHQLVALAIIWHTTTAIAQVNGPGPSDPVLFDTVINLPSAPDISNSDVLGGATGTTIQINVSEGGSIGEFVVAAFGSEVNVAGGSVGRDFRSRRGSEVNIRGGSIGDTFRAESGSVVDISGGSFGAAFLARRGSAVSISGGAFGSGFRTEIGSEVRLVGGDFLLNGATVPSGRSTLDSDDILTGTLTDGSTFIFGAQDGLRDITLTQSRLPAVNTTPFVVDSPALDRPSGLRSGQTLTLREGGQLGEDFEVVDATLVIEGGSIAAGGGSARSVVNVRGGFVGSAFTASSGSVVDVSEGVVDFGFRANSGSEVNIRGGFVGSFFNANPGSKVNLSGGSVGHSFRAHSGSEVSISGGMFDNRSQTRVVADSGSRVNLHGSDFAIDGSPLREILEEEAFTILERDVILTGILADGTPFEFDLNPIRQAIRSGRPDFFSPEAILTVTLAGVPEPVSATLVFTGLITISVLPSRRRNHRN